MQNSIKFLCRLGLIPLVLWLATPLIAFDLLKDDTGCVNTLTPGTFTMKVLIADPSSALSDGSTSYAPLVQEGMKEWNDVIGAVQLVAVVPAVSSTYSNGNGVNEIAMDSSVGSDSFSDGTLAVTMSYTVANTRVESDIIFNTKYIWDSYRGNLKVLKQDFLRVATHELGHVLGLDHPDEASPAQTVTAIMNSTVSNTESPQTDDINGAQALYGAPGYAPANDNFANATTLTMSGNSVEATGTNISATAETSEPKHAGETAARSVWWRWTAPSNADVTVTTYGSNFDTVLAVYTGSSVDALTSVASNDDEQSGTIRSSKLTFTPTAGTTYDLAVDGWDGYFGQISLSLTQGTVTGTAPTITTQPTSQTVTVGGSVTFSVAAANDPTTYQWYLNGDAISGATSSSYSISSAASTDAGSYSVVVGNASGSVTSTVVTLTVLSDTVTSQVVTTGHDVTLSAPSVDGTYQWQVSTDSGSTWTNVSDGSTYSGATTSALTITGATSSLSGYSYRYVITSDGGTTTSTAISLSVNSALIPFPVAIDVDGSGNLYVTDSSTHVVRKISTDNEVTTLAGTTGTTGTADGTGTAASFNQPSGISATSAGVLTVSDTSNATIRQVTAAGVVTTLAGSTSMRSNVDGTGTAATFSMPIGVAQNSSGTFYIADATNNTIRQLTSANIVSTFAGTAGTAGSADGTGTEAQFNYPTGVAVDSSGNVYVADTTNNLIRKITSAGTVSTLAGLVGVSGFQDGTGSGALFNQPEGLAVDSSDDLYVADTGNSAIRKITSAGVVTTVVGLSTVGGLKDGTGTDAWFNQPRDLTVDSSNNIYVADTGNAAIRKITSGGVVTTLELTAGSSPTDTGSSGSSGGSSSGGSSGGTTSSSGGGGGGGGGGAPSTWFLGLVGLLTLTRWIRRRRVA